MKHGLEAIRVKDEALKAWCEWATRMKSDHTKKLCTSFEDACENWDSLLQEPFDSTQTYEALAFDPTKRTN